MAEHYPSPNSVRLAVLTHLAHGLLYCAPMTSTNSNSAVPTHLSLLADSCLALSS